MAFSSSDSLDSLPLLELRSLVADLVGEVQSLRCDIERIHAENQELVASNDELRLANEALRAENGQLRDEIARLKKLPQRPPLRPSGMEKAMQADDAAPEAGRRRAAPSGIVTASHGTWSSRSTCRQGSRFKGYETSLVRDVVLSSEVVRYRRERWVTPDGQNIVAPMPAGVLGGFGPALRRFCLAMYTQGQVTTERLTSILNGIGVEISKRQVVRMLSAALTCSARKNKPCCGRGCCRHRSLPSTTPAHGMRGATL